MASAELGAQDWGRRDVPSNDTSEWFCLKETVSSTDPFNKMNYPRAKCDTLKLGF